MFLSIICLIFAARFYNLFTTVMQSKKHTKLTKKQIKLRRKWLTEAGYAFIITAVSSVHGVHLSKRTVDAYLRQEKVPKTGKRRVDKYGIVPLFIAATNAEKEKREKTIKQVTKNHK